MTKKNVETDWQCPSCNADTNSRVKDCCDYCLLTLFSGIHSPELDTAFSKYNSVSDWAFDKNDYSEEEEDEI